MNIVIMAGGKGSRIGNPDKPLIEVLGKPIIKHVVEAVEGLGTIYVATTAGHEKIIEWGRREGYEVILTSGRDYPNDLLEALRTAKTPTLVLPGDLPLLSRGLVTRFLRSVAYVRTPMVTLIAERDSKYEYTGISYVRDLVVIDGVIPWASVVIPWTVELVNVNTREDLYLVLHIMRHNSIDH